MSARVEEFEKWLKFLPWDPWLIPCVEHGKVPDIPKDESWKDAKYRLTVEQAKERIRSGLNVGVVATGRDFVFVDLDNPEKYTLGKKTLKVKTRNGKFHLHFINGGDVKNADGKGSLAGCGEVRAEWKYVLTPGSYVPPDEDAVPGATGLYTVAEAIPLATISASDLPKELQPSTPKAEPLRQAVMAGSFRNQYGWSLESLRKRDRKLDELLSTPTPAGYPSPSEADMATLSKLLFWGYSENEAIDILQCFRAREKLNRSDYVKMTAGKVSQRETIANYVDTSKWNPNTGYSLSFEIEPEKTREGTNLVFNIVSKHEIKVRAVKDGKAATSWVTVESPEKLRTSQNAKFLRKILQEEYPANWQAHLEETIGRIESAASNFTPQKKAEEDETETKIFDEETLSRARNLLATPEFFYKLGEVFEKGFIVPRINKPRFVIGEERNKRLIGPLLIGAAKLGMTSIIKVLGEPGTAKDTMLRMWLQLLSIKAVERSYMTAASLRYSPDMKDADLLYIPDTPELQGEMGRQLRFMRSDDGGLVSEYAVRDPESGEMTTKVVTLPIKGVATTSNAVTGDTALESGMWTLTTDPRLELTEEVKKEKLKFRAGKRSLISDQELDLWKAAFKILVDEEPQEIPQIPYAEQLFNLLKSERSESRRDPDKLCDLIGLIAWMRRFQKPKEKRMEADLVDLYFALQLGLDAITQTISELSPKEQQIFDVFGDAALTCRDVADATKIPNKSCYIYLEKLVDKGYLNKDKDKGRNVYNVLSQEKKLKSRIFSLGIRDLSPEQLLKVVLDTVRNSSLDTPGGESTDPLTFVDPLEGCKITITRKGDKDEVVIVTEKPDGSMETWRSEYPSPPLYPGRSVEPSKETASELEKKPKSRIPGETIRENTFFSENPAQTTLIPEKQPLTTEEIVEAMRSKWSKGLESDFENILVKDYGLSSEAASRLRAKLVDGGVMAYDPDGLLEWV
jgi:predicted transcriptional regulator